MICHGQLALDCLIYLSWLPAGDSISHWNTSLCPKSMFSFILSFIVGFPLLRCHLPFSAPILCFLWFHYFTEPLPFPHFVTLNLSLCLLVCFPPSIGGTYISIPISQLFKTWEVGLDVLLRSVIEQRGTELQVCSLEFIVQFCLCHWESLFWLEVPFLAQYFLWLDS